MTEYSVYIVRCGDGSLYTGIAIDPEARLRSHRAGRGARYLRGRAPLKLVFSQSVGSRGDASRLEHRVKQLDRTQKQALIEGRLLLASLLPDQARSGRSA